MDALFAILSFLIGFLAGTLGGLFGIGGAVFTIPAFRILLGLSGQAAIATALPLTIPSALSGAMHFRKSGLLRHKTILICGISGSAFALFGAYLTMQVAGRELMLGLSALLLLLGIFQYLSRQEKIHAENCSIYEKAGKTLSIGAIAGFVSGFFGVGGGPILVPLLTKIRQIRIKKAIPCSLAIIAIYAIPGSLAHLALGNTDLFAFFFACFGAALGARLGAKKGTSIPEEKMHVLYSILLLIAGTALIANELLSG